jgi:type IV fimbrial biogenesis protein FimT
MSKHLNRGQTDAPSAGNPRRRATRQAVSRSEGFTLVELALTAAVVVVLVAIALPATMNTMRNLRLSAAATAAAGAISSARYQAIMHAYPFNITFNSANATYQVASQAPLSTNFTNLGAAVPLSGNGDVTLSPTTTIQFNANGTVFATTGTLSFTISDGLSTKTISVSGVGDVSVN